MLSFLLLLLLPSSLSGASLNSPSNPWGEYAAECLVDQPNLWDESRIEQKWYVIDLDAEAHVMWKEVAEDFSEKMQVAIDVVKTMADTFGGEGAWEALLGLMENTPDMLTEPYSTEIKAMADLTGIRLEELTLLNLFYEIAKACTSLVAIDVNGKVFHGRNLDFGLFFVWNTEEHTWDLTRRLRDLVAQYEFHKDGKLLFKAVTFAGHLGILTAVRPGAYSLSSDTRFGSSYDTLVNFFMNGLEPNQQFILYANREMMTNCATFEEAKKYIETVEFLARGYFIMGSMDGGMVVTRAYVGADHEAVIDVKQANGWYVLETNYDWNEPDIYLDDRTIPGNKCMQQLGRKRVSKEGIFQVMSSKTTLNKATVYTSIMEIDTGDLYTFKQECKDPCWFV
ncbi:hypothetical protein PMAYCL1PPCAC_29211 [Pristionchus mayeri]|uniref:ceramidase n=1 Tax=Pristionchus mayeri TaxID=1317129 RepID=A0AAN5D914_9BILA|nr:hypothetical protein PMAYCL1PPCAC_29211 [Pristionchus mayeri]